MRAVHISEAGPPEVLVPQDTPLPDVKGTASVLVQVYHAGVNRPDVLQRKGVYPPPEWHSKLPGLEVSGVVVARGCDVPADAFPRVGDRVTALADGGGYAEFCAVPYGQCLPIPVGLSMQQAACLPETCFTVWHNLFQQTNVFGERLEAGKAILVHGGTGGIGYTAIQMAKAKGLVVYTTAGGKEKCDRALEFGADVAIDYRTADFVKEVKSLGGVDLVLDPICGEYVDRNMAVLKRGGRVAIIGSQGGLMAPNIDFRRALRSWLTVSASTIRARPSKDKQTIAQELLSNVWPFFEKGLMKAVIDSSFPLEQASQAHTRMETSAHIGKIVLDTAASYSN